MLRYKHTSVDDVPKLDEWVAADSAHRDLFTGEHFVLKPDEKGVQCVEVLDNDGTVFYLKFTNALLVEAQFPPEGIVSTDRVRGGLKEAFAYFALSSKKLGYHAMLFDSVSESLIAFFEKFGFRRLTDFFKVNL